MTTVIAYSPLHEWHKAHGVKFADHGPWRLASVFSNVAEEQTAARTGLALADLSALGKVSLQGKGVKDLVRSWFGETQPGHIFPLDERGFGWACVLRDDHCLIVSAQPSGGIVLDEIAQKRPGIRPDLAYDVTSGYACFGLFGPKHDTILRPLTALDLDSDLRPGICVQTAFAGVPAILMCPPGSLSCTWVLIAWDLAEYVWERVWQTGQSARMIPLGMDAYTSARSASEE